MGWDGAAKWGAGDIKKSGAVRRGGARGCQKSGAVRRGGARQWQNEPWRGV